MKVRELIELLKETDQENIVCFWDYNTLKEIDVVDELTDRVDLQAKE